MIPRSAVVWAGRNALVLGLSLLGLSLGLVGCGDDDGGSDASIDAGGTGGTSGSGGAGTGGTGGSGGNAGTGGVVDCDAVAPNTLPDALSCTGLYSDIEDKTIASNVHEFKPAVELWSDGAEKTRWVHLPAGTTIDTTNADAWQFPVGTKFFKEFKWNGKRVETRLFWKVRDDAPLANWLRTTYRWNDDETEATRFGGGDVQVDGDTYYIPSATDCDTCHKGRLDRALGFEALLLGLPGATGMNLAELESEGLLSGSVPSDLEIGDDGTGHASDALGWLHVNCGVSCHNANPASEAFATGLRLQLKVAEADGRSPNTFEAVTTSVNVDATVGAWLGRTRITPGSPADSLLYSLVTTRNAQMTDQMPPIATRIVPTEGAQLLRDWITSFGTGSSDGGMDSGQDAAADNDAGTN